MDKTDTKIELLLGSDGKFTLHMPQSTNDEITFAAKTICASLNPTGNLETEKLIMTLLGYKLKT